MSKIEFKLYYNPTERLLWLLISTRTKLWPRQPASTDAKASANWPHPLTWDKNARRWECFARNQWATTEPKDEVLLEEKWKLGLCTQPLMGNDRGTLRVETLHRAALCLKQRHQLDVQQSRQGPWPSSQVTGMQIPAPITIHLAKLFSLHLPQFLCLWSWRNNGP